MSSEEIHLGLFSIELWVLQIIVSITTLTTAVVTSAMVRMNIEIHVHIFCYFINIKEISLTRMPSTN